MKRRRIVEPDRRAQSLGKRRGQGDHRYNDAATKNANGDKKPG
jgi:hypothetical protein